jgi:transposase InsO family protein
MIGAASTPLTLWHACMRHMSNQALKHYKDSVKGITLDHTKVNNDAPCISCELRKQTWTSFPRSSKRSDQRLWIIHSDLTGPMQTHSIQGSFYITTFIDDYSRHGVVYYLKTKDQCAVAFKKFLAWAKNQTSDRLLMLHSDCGGEYLSSTLRSILDFKGIEHKLTMPHSP